MSSSFASSVLDPRRWSLTARLASLFAAALAAILFTVTGVQYDELLHEIHEDDEAELARSMASQADLVRSFAQKKLPEHSEREWIEHLGRGDRLFVRVFTPQGTVYAETPGMPPHSEFAPTGSKPKFRLLASGANSLLTTSVPVASAPDDTWSIEGALDVTPSGKILARYWTRLCVLLAAAVAAASVLGWLVARSGLAPLPRIGQAMERISAHQLNEPIGTQPRPAHLQSVAAA